MATGQYDLHLIPRAELQRVFGHIPAHLSRKQFDATEWWHLTGLPHNYREMLSSFSSLGPSWSEDMELWGQENGNRVDVEFNEGKVVGIFVRVDASNIKSAFINGVTAFARSCDCLLLTENWAIIEPIAQTLLEAVLQSDAQRFVQNPHQFINELESRRRRP